MAKTDNAPVPVAAETPEKETAYAVIRMAAQERRPAYPEIKKDKSKKIVSYGVDNDFPQVITEMNNQSAVNGAILESKVTYVCGGGIVGQSDIPDKPGYIGTPAPGETWDDLFQNIVTDRVHFGGVYLQVVRNKDTATVSVFHQDFSQVRIGETDEYGKPLSFKIAKDWTNISGKGKPIEIPVWPGNVQDMNAGQAYMYYDYDYRPGLRHYPVPSYYNAFEYVKADGELGQFYNNAINNNFTPSVVITMPSNPDEETKKTIQRKMENAFTGARGACSVVIVWGENSGVKPEIEPFNATNNADIYNSVEAIIFQKIVSAHRLTSPTLAGLAGSGNLSGNAAEIIDAWILFNYTVIEQLRRKCLKPLNIFGKINGRAEMKVRDLDVIEKIQEAKNASNNTIKIDNGTGPADTESLAAKLGVAGVQALSAILADPNMNETLKRGSLAVIFGLDDAQIDRLFTVKE